MMIRSSIIVFFILLKSLVYGQSGKIVVQISEFRNTKGLARITLFDQSKGFPSKYKFGLKSKSIKLDTTLITVEFDSLDNGNYALSVLHDENGNGKMDTNFIGIPKEGYGVSNNINPKMRAPTFDEAMFSLDKEKKQLKVTLHYR
jgi:uncharacterized protein (DUF2141 family)